MLSMIHLLNHPPPQGSCPVGYEMLYTAKSGVDCSFESGWASTPSCVPGAYFSFGWLGLHFGSKKKTKFQDKSSIFYRSFSNRSEALVVINTRISIMIYLVFVCPIRAVWIIDFIAFRLLFGFFKFWCSFPNIISEIGYFSEVTFLFILPFFFTFFWNLFIAEFVLVQCQASFVASSETSNCTQGWTSFYSLQNQRVVFFYLILNMMKRIVGNDIDTFFCFKYIYYIILHIYLRKDEGNKYI